MKSSIFISSEKIEVMSYRKHGKRIRVKAYETAPLPEGAMINGMILDPAAVVDGLVSLKNRSKRMFKNVSLVVDGSSILIKRLTVPKLSRKQYYNLAADELSDNPENIPDFVRDYQILNRSGKNKEPGSILAIGTNKSVVDSYMSVFKSAEIELDSIRIGVLSLLDYVNAVPELSGKTFVLNVVDGVMMLSIIFDKGANVFMSRSRLYGESEEDLSGNILENLSGLLQFNKSENFNDITHSYYLGLSAEMVSNMSARGQFPGIVLGVIDLFSKTKGSEKLGSEAHFVFLNALHNKGGTDLIVAHKELAKFNKRSKPKQIWPLFLAVLLLLLAAPAGYFLYQMRDLNLHIDAAHRYLNDPYIAEKSHELRAVQAETELYNDIVAQLLDKKNANAQSVEITSEITDLLIRSFANRVNVIRLEYVDRSNTVSLSANAATESDASEFTQMLGYSSLVSNVVYTGYSYTGDGSYSFTISVTLAQREDSE